MFGELEKKNTYPNALRFFSAVLGWQEECKVKVLESPFQSTGLNIMDILFIYLIN